MIKTDIENIEELKKDILPKYLFYFGERLKVLRPCSNLNKIYITNDDIRNKLIKHNIGVGLRLSRYEYGPLTSRFYGNYHLLDSIDCNDGYYSFKYYLLFGTDDKKLFSKIKLSGKLL